MLNHIRNDPNQFLFSPLKYLTIIILTPIEFINESDVHSTRLDKAVAFVPYGWHDTTCRPPQAGLPTHRDGPKNIS